MSSESELHDAQKALSDLRDHLARHDKPIAFLFGAGTGCAVRVADENRKIKSLIPAVGELTTLCRAAAGGIAANFAKAWELIEEQCGTAGQDPNVENVLSRVRMMLAAVGGTDTLAGLKKEELIRLEESIRMTIAKTVTPDLEKIKDEFPHRRLARWLVKTSRKNPVEIFTVNYDVLIEHALELERVPVFDGFVGSYEPFFCPDSLRRIESAPGANWTRLWKMHGSVTWRRVNQNGKPRVVRGQVDPNGEMILPSFQKYDESRQQPYSAFTERLSRFLDQDDALLVASGFSFSDEHINNLVFGALENRPRTHVYALQFEEPPDESDLSSRAMQRPNMIVLGPKTGIIGGQKASWSPVKPPSFLKDVFEVTESGAAVEAGKAEGASARMKIGDFSSLCSLLESITVG